MQISREESRICFHLQAATPGSFTARYNVNRRVYCAEFGDIKLWLRIAAVH